MIQFGIMSVVSLGVGALSAYVYFASQIDLQNREVVYSPVSESEELTDDREFLNADTVLGEEIMIDPTDTGAYTPFTVSATCLPDVEQIHQDRSLQTEESDIGDKLIIHPRAYSFQEAEESTNGAFQFFEVSQTSLAPSSPRVVGIEFYTEESISQATENVNDQGPFQGMTLDEYREVVASFDEELLPERGEVQQIQCQPWIVETVQGAGPDFWLRFYDTVIDDQVVRVTFIQDNTQYNGFLTGSFQNVATDELFALFSIR